MQKKSYVNGEPNHFMVSPWDCAWRPKHRRPAILRRVRQPDENCRGVRNRHAEADVSGRAPTIHFSG